MPDEQGDPYREHTDESGTMTPGSASSKGAHADGQPIPSDDGGQTGLLGNTGVGPNWMQDHGTNAEPEVSDETESPS